MVRTPLRTALENAASSVPRAWHTACNVLRQEVPVRHAVLAAAVAFQAPLGLGRGPVGDVTRRGVRELAAVVMRWLDRRRERIDGR